jgi:hypothetical protein
VHQDGSIECWDEDGVTLQQAGPFVRVDTNHRVCALSADGEMSCWEPYESFPSGPFLQLFPQRAGGCGLKTTGEVVCVADGGSASFEQGLRAALFRAHVRDFDATGIRPDGRVIRWDSNGRVAPGRRARVHRSRRRLRQLWPDPQSQSLLLGRRNLRLTPRVTCRHLAVADNFGFRDRRYAGR